METATDKIKEMLKIPKRYKIIWDASKQLGQYPGHNFNAEMLVDELWAEYKIELTDKEYSFCEMVYEQNCVVRMGK